MKNSRRSFVKKLAAGALAAGFLPRQAAAARKTQIIDWERPQQKFSPNDKIRVAGIGMGIMGFNNCRTTVKVPGVELVATCDLYDGRLERSKEVFGNQLFTTRSYREILDRKDIDAVIIATSDHWHDHIAIAAMQAGKAVYCEKPMVQHIDEGKAVIDAQKKTGRVLQVGSQGVSSITQIKARELFMSGAIGQLVAAEGWNDRQSASGAWQYSIPTDASPKTVDWENFQGDAPRMPFDATRFFRWRNYRDYGTGVAGDLFVHLFSGLHNVTGSAGPERIFASGGLRYWKDGRDVPDLVLAMFDYPEAKTHPAFNLQLRVNFTSGDGGGQKTRLVGTDGVIELGGESVTVHRHKAQNIPTYGGWDSFDTFSSAQQKEYEAWYKNKYPALPPVMQEPAEQRYQAPEGYDDHLDHHTNFYNAIRNGTTPVEDAVFGLRAAAPSLAANMSYFEGKMVK
ncbi:MAG: Gfo/Idh/MocA family oxidoreductase, partial [Bacteroidetes bacterium]|nr:Gfo/Idh/MocA family oxidoreductase [Bacteroidota bacterium]